MRTAVVAAVLLAAVAGAQAFATLSALKALPVKANFNPQALGNPCASPAAGCTAGCGYGSVCTGADIATGTCQYLSVGKSCGDTCQPFNSTSFVFPSASVCPGGTTCDVTGSSGTAYTCGFGARTNYALVGCACTSSGNECRSPATCQNNVCSLSGRSALPTGATCVNGNDCSSGTCTSGACAARSPSCFTSGDCAVGKACNATSGACVDPIANGGACYLNAQGVEQVSCVAGSGCLGANAAWGVCTQLFSVASGSRCYGNPLWCSAGLACDVSSATGTCSSSGSCNEQYASGTCAPGQWCACSGTSATCQGPTISSSCADKYRNQATSCAAGPRDIPAVPLNYDASSLPSGCVSASADFFCDRSCAGPDSAFGGRGGFIGGNVDYRMINCGSKSIVAYSSSQNFGCTRAYCPTAFNAATSASASALVVAAAVATAVLAALRN